MMLTDGDGCGKASVLPLEILCLLQLDGMPNKAR